jgi:L-threonylcarbamoyladenylate synthase
VSSAEIERAADVLASGGLVAFPTETVYGLGAMVVEPDAVQRVFAVKGRPAGHPLIVHLGGVASLDRWAADVPDAARRLGRELWPGPLTLVLRRSERVPAIVTGGRDTVGLRVPAHPVALGLLAALDSRRPGEAAVAAPSANRFGRVSPTTAAHVHADLGDDVDLVLDGGPCAVGVESTIVDLSGERPEVLRLGAITRDELASVLGSTPAVATGEARASGMLPAHYAPAARVVVVPEGDDVGERAADEVARAAGLGPVVLLAPSVVDDLPAEVVELEPAGPPEDYARVLYDRLRQADRLGAAAIVVVPPPAGGIGDAVRDRLTRAERGRGSA